ncbi:MAG: M48 family metalloprotease [Porticoccaceae bacterium]
MFKLSSLLVIVLFLTACAAPSTSRISYATAEIDAEAALQRELALKKYLSYKQRLHSVSYPILKSASEFCTNKQINSVGAQGAASADFEGGWKIIASKVFEGDEFTITWVDENGPAAKAGLAVNDKVLAVNNVAFGDNQQQQQKFYAETARIKTSKSLTTSLKIKRNQQLINLTISQEKICGYPVVLGDSDAVNAYADGKKIIITKGMMRFARDDQDLALVIAHELGHNLMGHIDKKQSNYMLGTLIDLAAAANGVNTRGTFGSVGASAFSQDFEAEADYVALYYMNAAGLPLEGVADFWREMAAEHPGSISSNHSASHPATSERFLAISKTIAEINHKIAAGEPLRPTINQ